MIDVKSVLPHRYPFLFVDRVVEYEPGKFARGYKNISINEWFFEGHFPGNPIVPGVIITEALAQMSAFSVNRASSQGAGGVIISIANSLFKKKVVPGDRLDLYFQVDSHRGPYLKGNAEATVAGELVAKLSDILIYTEK